jgi:hypothetical protein
VLFDHFITLREVYKLAAGTRSLSILLRLGGIMVKSLVLLAAALAIPAFAAKATTPQTPSEKQAEHNYGTAAAYKKPLVRAKANRDDTKGATGGGKSSVEQSTNQLQTMAQTDQVIAGNLKGGTSGSTKGGSGGKGKAGATRGGKSSVEQSTKLLQSERQTSSNIVKHIKP